MWGNLLGVVGLAVLCGLWVLVQRWLARRDPESPGVEGNCASCGASCHEDSPGSDSHCS